LLIMSLMSAIISPIVFISQNTNITYNFLIRLLNTFVFGYGHYGLRSVPNA